MRLTFRIGDVLDDEASALIINVDAASRRTTGRVAAAFEKRIGEAEWDYVLEQVRFPFHHGGARLAEIDSEAVHFRHVIVAGAFDHLLEGAHAHQALLARATRSALQLALRHRLPRVAVAFSRAGWRLDTVQGVKALWEACAGIAAPLELSVSVPDEEALRALSTFPL